jgi:putative DNA primase/helicase
MKHLAERRNGTAEREAFQCSTIWEWNGGTPDIPALARALLGAPNPAVSRGSQWRYGARGSLAVDVARGIWCDHEAGQGGGILALVQRERGGTLADAARWLEAFHCSTPTPWNSGTPPIRAPLARDPVPEAQPGDGGWERIWRASEAPERSPAARYLEGRGLALPTEPGRVLRFNPACPFGSERRPAMVALIRNAETGRPQGVHRTPLTLAGERARGPDGSKLPKMILGAAAGGAVMLSPDREVEAGLAIAEGIESALAGLRRRPSLPTWAALSAGGVRVFPVLAGVEALAIYADHDAPGLEAARACAARWAAAGRYAEVQWPRAAGADMADLACRST